MHIDSKFMRPLAVTTTKRSPDLPNVPTIVESGFVGFEAPAKTPPDTIKRMNKELIMAIHSPVLESFIFKS